MFRFGISALTSLEDYTESESIGLCPSYIQDLSNMYINKYKHSNYINNPGLSTEGSAVIVNNLDMVSRCYTH